jgi:hypothetical protein
MEPAVQLRPRYVVFDLSPGAGLRCFTAPAPVVEHAGVPLRTVALGLEALRRTRLSRADDLAAAHRQAQQVVRISSDPNDTVSDAGTSGVHQPAEESEDDEAGSWDDEGFFEEGFARKVDALAALVGMKGAYEPAAVLGEVVGLLEAAGKNECSVRATTAV